MKKEITKTEWFNGLYIILYFIICYIAAFVIFFIVLFQFISAILTQKPNEHLARFGQSMSMYAYEIIQFITYNTHQKPFPFKPWPSSSIAVVESHSETRGSKKQS